MLKSIALSIAISLLLVASSVGIFALGLRQEDTVASLRHRVVELTRQRNEAYDALSRARAERANCEATLGPIEAAARLSESDRFWDQLKTELEKWHPNSTCDPRTLICTPKK